MSFEAHYQKVDKIRSRAFDLARAAVPDPDPAKLLTEEGRKAYFNAVLGELSVLLKAAVEKAEAAGIEHARDVLRGAAK